MWIDEIKIEQDLRAHPESQSYYIDLVEGIKDTCPNIYKAISNFKESSIYKAQWLIESCEDLELKKVLSFYIQGYDKDNRNDFCNCGMYKSFKEFFFTFNYFQTHENGKTSGNQFCRELDLIKDWDCSPLVLLTCLRPSHNFIEYLYFRNKYDHIDLRDRGINDYPSYRRFRYLNFLQAIYKFADKGDGIEGISYLRWMLQTQELLCSNTTKLDDWDIKHIDKMIIGIFESYYEVVSAPRPLVIGQTELLKLKEELFKILTLKDYQWITDKVPGLKLTKEEFNKVDVDSKPISDLLGYLPYVGGDIKNLLKITPTVTSTILSEVKAQVYKIQDQDISTLIQSLILCKNQTKVCSNLSTVTKELYSKYGFDLAKMLSKDDNIKKVVKNICLTFNK